MHDWTGAEAMAGAADAGTGVQLELPAMARTYQPALVHEAVGQPAAVMGAAVGRDERAAVLEHHHRHRLGAATGRHDLTAPDGGQGLSHGGPRSRRRPWLLAQQLADPGRQARLDHHHGALCAEYVDGV